MTRSFFNKKTFVALSPSKHFNLNFMLFHRLDPIRIYNFYTNQIFDTINRLIVMTQKI